MTAMDLVFGGNVRVPAVGPANPGFTLPVFFDMYLEALDRAAGNYAATDDLFMLSDVAAWEKHRSGYRAWVANGLRLPERPVVDPADTWMI